MVEKYNTLSILAIIFTFAFYPIGLILGIIALSQIKKTQERGRGLALVPIVIGFILLALIVIGIVWVVIRGASEGNSDNILVNEQSLELISNKSFDVRLCQYELNSYYISGQYATFNQKVNACKTKINELRVEVERLILTETDEQLKREYQALKLDFEGAATAMDFLTLEVSILSAEEGSLSMAEYELKVDAIKLLYTQYLDIINKLETQYSDTYFFQTNYRTPEGKELLEQAKINVQTSLDAYNNLTIN
ncbi:MAG TPA: DUF4190 domain-containing protein [Candidatus Nanoarchaeia archaeon]|nr:DUF4190 domain-containing protein [Candidatus Nanoarchaeia archaeon]